MSPLLLPTTRGQYATAETSPPVNRYASQLETLTPCECWVPPPPFVQFNPSNLINVNNSMKATASSHLLEGPLLSKFTDRFSYAILF